ncbi:unnamed protein product [Microthlaspi erraticum]|uniref:Uncharacterized protein n=1 Tax=Microthlaspi erraticum TaxID=1685480 RepID=A0A6D2HUA5_9BRAS|nr:unnamed protein product [Microthlaspi erraticum]
MPSSAAAGLGGYIGEDLVFVNSPTPPSPTPPSPPSHCSFVCNMTERVLKDCIADAKDNWGKNITRGMMVEGICAAAIFSYHYASERPVGDHQELENPFDPLYT